MHYVDLSKTSPRQTHSRRALRRHFPTQGSWIFRYLKTHYSSWTYSLSYLLAQWFMYHGAKTVERLCRSFPTWLVKFANAHGLTQSKACQVLETLLSYALHKPRRRHFPTLPVMVFKVDQQWVMDLMDIQKLAKWNKGHRYILTVVDVLSKYAWAIPIKNKTGAVMVQALQTLWKQASPRQPQRVQSDDGTEFMNAKVQAFFNNIK